MDRITLTAEDIAAIEEFLTLNHNLSAQEVADRYGWKHAVSINHAASAFRKIGIKIPRTKRRIDSLTKNVLHMSGMNAADRALFLQWKAERAAQAEKQDDAA